MASYDPTTCKPPSPDGTAIWPTAAYKRSLALFDASLTTNNPLHTEAIATVASAISLYGPSQVIVSFNGGKDATVVAAVTCAAFADYYRRVEGDAVRIPPRGIFFDDDSDFEEVKLFVRKWATDYGLDVIRFVHGTKFNVGLTSLVYNTQCSDRDDVPATVIPQRPTAFILGTRENDPNSNNQNVWAPSSSSYMPPFMRVNPIYSWTYGDTWDYLRTYGGGFCELYKEGYTSLGKREDTKQCPSLYDDASGSYRPAWALLNWDKEREGRVKANPPAPSSPPAKIALLIIGDEILSGLTPDTNTAASIAAFASYNLKLSTVKIVPDDVEVIAEEVRQLGTTADCVITSGGLGPTHDDVTIQAISQALKCEPVTNFEMLTFITMKEEELEPKTSELDACSPRRRSINNAHRKMSQSPSLASGTQLLFLAGESEWPTLKCGGSCGVAPIFVLPGVPLIFEKKIAAVASYVKEKVLCSVEPKGVMRKLFLSCSESSLVETVNNAVERFPSLKFGSYPQTDEDFRVVVTIEATAHDSDLLEEAVEMLRKELKEDMVIHNDKDPMI